MDRKYHHAPVPENSVRGASQGKHHRAGGKAFFLLDGKDLEYPGEKTSWVGLDEHGNESV